jgi:uncharacterized protein (DUF2062 family)
MKRKAGHESADKWKDRLYRYLRESYRRIVTPRGDPRRAALGFAEGVFIGFSPLLGFHTILAVFLASLFRWNKISAAVGVWVCNPFTAPFIFSLDYLVGARILKMEGVLDVPDEIPTRLITRMLHEAPEVFSSILIGGVILGLPCAVLSYYVSYPLIKKYQGGIREKLRRRREERAKEKAKEESGGSV